MQLHQSINLRRQQSGSTLIISMIILILLMLLGVTAMRTSNTHFQLAGNLQFEDSAMNNAETVISIAENWLKTGTNYKNAGLISDPCNDRSVNHLYPMNTTVTPSTPCMLGYAAPENNPLTMTWDNSHSLLGLNGNQRYIIELLSTNNQLLGSDLTIDDHPGSPCNKVNTYRITARGTSARGAIKFVQSYYSVINC